MLHAILNKSWKSLYGHLHPTSQTIWWRYCWRSKNKLIADVLLLTPTHGHTSVGWPVTVQTLDALLRICQEWWLIETDNERERERESKRNLWHHADALMIMMIELKHNLFSCKEKRIWNYCTLAKLLLWKANVVYEFFCSVWDNISTVKPAPNSYTGHIFLFWLLIWCLSRNNCTNSHYQN